MFEPTKAQEAAARALERAGIKADNAERAWGRALEELSSAVSAAHAAGIPRRDILPLVTLRLNGLGGASGEKLRAMIRRYYT